MESHRPHVATVTLNQPDKLNALDDQMFSELLQVCRDLEADNDIRVVVVTGSGRAFCSGRDLTDVSSIVDVGLSEGLTEIDREGLAVGHPAFTKPVIAAVNGPARGGGFSFAASADIRVASSTASFGVALINLGLSAGDAGLSWTLPRLIGYGAARELMLTGRVIDATEALRLGLVSKVVAPEELLDAAYAIADEITVHQPLGLRLTKEVINRAAASSYEDALNLESRYQQLAFQSEAVREHRRAFVTCKEGGQ